MTYGIRDIKEAVKLADNAVERLTKLDEHFATPELLGKLSVEEQEVIRASVMGRDLIEQAINILDELKVSMQNEGGEDSDDESLV
jgi:hypothetical protein